MANSKTPNIEILQKFLEDEPHNPSEVIHWLKEKQESIRIINDTFFSKDIAPQYLPMLDEARKRSSNIYKTLTSQVETQCEVAQPAQSSKNRLD
ncbi:MAG: hypothetical protein JSR17_03430 [Proteobacteria bacterium]|nr:hypothetical protein [Pseudomonadota bacterium]